MRICRKRGIIAIGERLNGTQMWPERRRGIAGGMEEREWGGVYGRKGMRM